MRTYQQIIQRAIDRDELDKLSPYEKSLYRLGTTADIFKKPMLSAPARVPDPPEYYRDSKTGELIRGDVNQRTGKILAPEGSIRYGKVLSDAARDKKGIYKQYSPLFDINKPLVRDVGEYVIPDKDVRTEYDPTDGNWIKTRKQGWLGDQKGWDGNLVRDYSWLSDIRINGIQMSMPLITEKTTGDELSWLLSGKEPTKDIIDKANKFARDRIMRGLSPFKGGRGASKLTPIQSYTEFKIEEKGEISTNKVAALLRGLGEGITTELPRMTGEAWKFLGAGPAGNALTEWANKQSKNLWGSKPEYDEFTRWFYEAGKIIPTSAVPGGISLTGARILLSIGLRLKHVQKTLKTVHNLKASYQTQRLGTKLSKNIKIAKKQKKAMQDAYHSVQVDNATKVRMARRDLKTAQHMVNRVTSASVGGFFGLSAAQHTKEITWDRIRMLEDQGDFKGANALRKTLSWAPFITGLIEGSGEYFGTKYLAKLFMVSTAEIGAKTTTGWLTDLILNMGRVAGVEMGTEAAQQAGIATTEKLTGIRPEAEILAEVVSVLGPAAVAAFLFAGASGVGNYPRARKSIEHYQIKQKEKDDRQKYALETKMMKKTFDSYASNTTPELAAALEGKGINTGNWVDYIAKIAEGLPEEEFEATVRSYMIWTLAKIERRGIQNEQQLAADIIQTEASKVEGHTEASFLDYIGWEMEMLLARQHSIQLKNKKGEVREPADVRKDIISYYDKEFPDARTTLKEGVDVEVDPLIQKQITRKEKKFTFDVHQYLTAENDFKIEDLNKMAREVELIRNDEDITSKGWSNTQIYDKIFLASLLGGKNKRRASIANMMRTVDPSLGEIKGDIIDGHQEKYATALYRHFMNKPIEFKKVVQALIDQDLLLYNITDGGLHVPIYDKKPAITAEEAARNAADYALRIMKIRIRVGEVLGLEHPGFLELGSALYFLADNSFIDNYSDWENIISEQDSIFISRGISPYKKGQQPGRSVNKIQINNIIKDFIRISNEELETNVVVSPAKVMTTTAGTRMTRENYRLFSDSVFMQMQERMESLKEEGKDGPKLDKVHAFTMAMDLLHQSLEADSNMRDILITEDGDVKPWGQVPKKDWKKFLQYHREWYIANRTRTVDGELKPPANDTIKNHFFRIAEFFHVHLGWEDKDTTLLKPPFKAIVQVVTTVKVAGKRLHPTGVSNQSKILAIETMTTRRTWEKNKSINNARAHFLAIRDLLASMIYTGSGIRATENNPTWASLVSNIAGTKAEIDIAASKSVRQQGREAIISNLKELKAALKMYYDALSRLLSIDNDLRNDVKLLEGAGEKQPAKKNQLQGKPDAAPNVLFIDFTVSKDGKARLINEALKSGDRSYKPDAMKKNLKASYQKSILLLLRRTNLTNEERGELEKYLELSENFVQHGYRHVFIYELLAAGWDSRQVAAFVGHIGTDINTAYINEVVQEMKDFKQKRDNWMTDVGIRRKKSVLIEPDGIGNLIKNFGFLDLLGTTNNAHLIAPSISWFRDERIFIAKNSKGKLIYVYRESGIHSKAYEVSEEKLSEVTALPLEFRMLKEQLSKKSPSLMSESQWNSYKNKLFGKDHAKTEAKAEPEAKEVNLNKTKSKVIKSKEKQRKLIKDLSPKRQLLHKYKNAIKKAVEQNKLKKTPRNQKQLIDDIINIINNMLETSGSISKANTEKMKGALNALENTQHRITKDNANTLDTFIQTTIDKIYYHIRIKQDIVNGQSWNAEIFEAMRPVLLEIGNKLGLKNYKLVGNFEDIPEPLDLDTEYGRRVLSEAGMTQEEIESARQNREEFYEDGTYQAFFDEKNPQGRAVITLRHGANFATAIHEFIHLYSQQGGEVKGITDRLTRGIAANEEWMARKLTEILIKIMKKKGLRGVMDVIDKRFKEATGVMDPNIDLRSLHSILHEGETPIEPVVDKIHKEVGSPLSFSKEERALANEFSDIAKEDVTETTRMQESARKMEKDKEKKGTLSGEVRGVIGNRVKMYLDNTRVAAKMNSWSVTRKILEFLQPIMHMDSSHHILAARHMKDGKIERGLNFIQNRLTPLLKKIPDSVINVFFGYTNGDYNDKNIKYGQMSMAARNEEYSGRFDKKDIIDNEIKELEAKEKSLNEELGKIGHENKEREDYLAITNELFILNKEKESKGKDIEALGLSKITLLSKTEKHEAYTLENPTRKEFNNAYNKIMTALERIYWEDDKVALKKARDAGLPAEFLTLGRQAKVMQLEMGKHLLRVGLIPDVTYWTWYGLYIHHMYLRDLIGWNSGDMRTIEENLMATGTWSGILEQRENKTPQEKAQIALLKDVNIVIPYGVGKTLGLLANVDYFNVLSSPETRAIIPFNTLSKDIPNMVKKKKGWVIEHEMTEEELRTFRKFKVVDDKTWMIEQQAKSRTKNYLIDGLRNKIKQMELVIKKLETDPPAGYTKKDRAIIQKYTDKLKALYAPVETHLAKDNQKLSDYVRLGENYGEISHEYLAKGVYDDITPLLSNTAAKKGQLFTELMKWNATATMVFKAGKVAVNPPTMFRNIISNLLQNNMRGRPLPHVLLDFVNAIRSIAAGDRWWKEARDIGVFRGQQMKEEAKEALEHLGKEGAHTRWFKFMTWLVRQTKWYGKIDEIAKLSIYRQLREKGSLNRFGIATGKKVSKYEAAITAVKWGMDYSLASVSIKRLRKQAIPFVTYQYKILPLILDSLAHRPWVLGKWAGFLGVGSLGVQGIAQTVSQSLLGMSNAEWERLLKQLPDFITENNTFIPLPWKSKEGKVMWFDGLYFMPFGTWLSTLKGLSKGEVAEVFKEIGIGNPFLSVYQAINSATRDKPAIDPFTKQPIYNMIDTPLERYHKIFSWMQNVVAPGWLENITIPSAQKKGPLGISMAHIYNLVRNREYRDKWHRLMGWEQHLRWFGINPYIFSAEQTWAIRKAKEAYYQKQYKQKIRQLNPYRDWLLIEKYTKRFHKKVDEIRGQEVGASGGSRWY